MISESSDFGVVSIAAYVRLPHTYGPDPRPLARKRLSPRVINLDTGCIALCQVFCTISASLDLYSTPISYHPFDILVCDIVTGTLLNEKSIRLQRLFAIVVS